MSAWLTCELENFDLSLRQEERTGLKSPAAGKQKTQQQLVASSTAKKGKMEISREKEKDKGFFASLFAHTFTSFNTHKEQENQAPDNVSSFSYEQKRAHNALTEHVSPIRGGHSRPLTPRSPGFKPVKLEDHFNQLQLEVASSPNIYSADTMARASFPEDIDSSDYDDIIDEDDYDDIDYASCPFSPNPVSPPPSDFCKPGTHPSVQHISKSETDLTVCSPTSFRVLEPYDERVPTWVLDIEYGMICKSTTDRYAKLFPNRSKGPVEFRSFSPALSHSRRGSTTINDFELGRPIGSGRFGSIYVARVKRDPSFIVAIKAIAKKEVHKPNVVEQLVREINNLQSLRGNRNIGQLFDHFQDRRFIYLIMEYAPGGDLYHLIQDEYSLEEVVAARIMRHALLAVKGCHDTAIMHRDIKPENLVIGADGYLKLIDFGWSAPIEAHTRRSTICGTLDYLPPEMLRGRRYGHSIDVWCLGILAWELLAGSPPFEKVDRHATTEAIKKAKLDFPSSFSNIARSFLTQAIKKEPCERKTVDELLQHPWIQKNCTEDDTLTDLLG